LYVPAAHGTQECADALAYPALQTHARSDTSPTAVDDEPAGQNVHAADPASGLYVPDPQSAHGLAPSAPVLPAMHSHTSGDVAAVSSVYLPAVHLVHATAQTPGLYVPCPQGVHALVYPAVHMHVHTSDVAPPMTMEYFPASQNSHASIPARGVEYCPTPHCTHEYADPDVNHSTLKPT